MTNCIFRTTEYNASTVIWVAAGAAAEDLTFVITDRHFEHMDDFNFCCAHVEYMWTKLNLSLTHLIYISADHGLGMWKIVLACLNKSSKTFINRI